MKSQRTNAFQLMVAGAVLVLVLVCGTFAWFAVGNFSNLRNVLASIGNAGIPNQLNSIQYSENGESWEEYDGQKLAMEPGKVWYFRAGFTAGDGTAVRMSLVNIDGTYREPVKPSSEEDGSAETATLPTAAAAAKFTEVLEYRLGQNNDAAFTKLALEADNRTAVIMPAKQAVSFPKEGVQYLSYYQIKMSEEATLEEYRNLSVSFDLQLEFQDTLTTEA